MKKLLALFILPLLVAGSLSPVFAPSASAVTAGDWNAGRIIDDSKFTGLDMSVADIQNFLNAKVPVCDTWGTQPASEYGRSDLTHAQYAASRGWPAPPYVCLKNYYEVPKTAPGPGVPANSYGNGGNPPAGSISAAQMIYNAAQQYRISPKVLLVKLDTESAGPLTRDSWPLPTQYKFAMGAHCPDSGPGGAANCDANYAGFSIQISEAAALLRYYLDGMTQSWWQYKKPFQTNNILWNVAPSGCGGSNVYLETMGSAALYTYTPYQPNQAALNNMYGTGDRCSAYGNRNFWRVYNDWFGPSLNSIRYVQDANSAAQYILYNGKKQALTYDGLLAWGVNRLSISTLPRTTLDSIPSTATPLTRLSKIEGTNSMVFADNAKYYDVTEDLKQTWGNFNNIQQSSIPWAVLDIVGFGGLLPTVVNANANQYLMESGQLHKFASPAMLRTWVNPANGSVTLSSTYLQNVTIGADLNGNLAKYAGTTYLVDGARMYPIPSKTLALYSTWTSLDVSAGSIRRYKNSGGLSYLQKGTANTIYLLDQNQKRPISSFQLFNALRSGDIKETTLSNDAINLLPTGTAVSSSFVRDTNTSKLFYINQNVTELSPGVSQQYSASSLANDVSPAFIQLFSASTAQPTSFAKNTSDAGVYLIDSGKRIPITKYSVLYALDGENKITTLPDNDLLALPLASDAMTLNIQATSRTERLIDRSKSYSIPSADVRAAWNLLAPTNVSEFTFDAILGSKSLSTLSTNIQAPNGEFCAVDRALWCAESVAMIYAWKLQSGLIRPSTQLLDSSSLGRTGKVSAFVTGKRGQQHSGMVFSMVDGKLYYINTPQKMQNLGFDGSLTPLNDSMINSIKQTVLSNGYLYKTPDQALWVIDSGMKRSAPSSIATNWAGIDVQPTPVSHDFLFQFKTAASLTKSITSSSTPAIFGMDSGKKRAISTYQKYSQSWAPYSTVSLSLLLLVPSGADL